MGAAWSEKSLPRELTYDEDGNQSAACRWITLELNTQRSQSAALMSNPPPGPATTPTRSVCVSVSACPPRTAELLLRNGLLPEVHRKHKRNSEADGLKNNSEARSAHSHAVSLAHI